MSAREPLLGGARKPNYEVYYALRNGLILFHSIFIVILIYALIQLYITDDANRISNYEDGKFAGRLIVVFGSLIAFLLSVNCLCAESWKALLVASGLIAALIALTISDMDWQWDTGTFVVLIASTIY